MKAVLLVLAVAVAASLARRGLRRRVDRRHPRRVDRPRDGRRVRRDRQRSRTRRSGRTPTSSRAASPAGRTRSPRSRTSLRSDAGLDYEKDVEPALGPELDLVWLDFANDGENVVALMQPDDPEAFQRVVARATRRTRPTSSLYEEVDGWR